MSRKIWVEVEVYVPINVLLEVEGDEFDVVEVKPPPNNAKGREWWRQRIMTECETELAEMAADY